MLGHQAMENSMRISLRRYIGDTERIALLTLVDKFERPINYILIIGNLPKVVSATEASDTITRLMAQDNLRMDGQEEFVDIFRPTQSKGLGDAPTGKLSLN